MQRNETTVLGLFNRILFQMIVDVEREGDVYQASVLVLTNQVAAVKIYITSE